MAHKSEQPQQKAFHQLRPVCVELSSVALRFKGRQSTVKDVLAALKNQHQVLQILASQNDLDEKLAEYSFFPLTHIFNESSRLSPACMQIAVQSVTVLVSHAWRLNLAPAMGKQLLILMTLLTGNDPRKQLQPPTDELKVAAFNCIEALVKWMARIPTSIITLQDQSTRNIVDQLAYLLLDSLIDTTSDTVQLAAVEALLTLNTGLTDRVLLASLLPRTVSSLAKVLKSSTQARRTRKVLVADLRLLGVVLKALLADDVVLLEQKSSAEKEALDHSWLKATTAQIKNALLQVCRLRTHDQIDVRQALFQFCVMIVEECSNALEDSAPILLETCVVLTNNVNDESMTFKLKCLIVSRPKLAEILQSSFYDWCMTLPRIMQGNDDRPKENMLVRINNSFHILSETMPDHQNMTSVLGSTLLKSVTNIIEPQSVRKAQVSENGPIQYQSLIQQNNGGKAVFSSILFNHQSQIESAKELHKLIQSVKEHSSGGDLTRTVVDNIPELDTTDKIAPIWLAIQLLRRQSELTFDLDDILDLTTLSGNRSTSRAFLIHDLYAHTKDILIESSPHNMTSTADSQLIALTLESVALQAQQLGQAYRIELYETLYPIISLLSSSDSLVSNHAITALNQLASSCEYGSVSNLLIENADYLVNSIAWRLNTFNLSPEAPAVLNMVIRLVGAKVLPYLDDLITSIFAALDSFHGYTQWVEMLFEALKTMVDESVRTPELAITDGRGTVSHMKPTIKMTTLGDIIGDLQARKRRKLTSGTSTHVQDLEAAPTRPWTRAQDDPNYRPDPTEGKDLETLMREAETADEENELPAPKEPEEEDPTKPLSKSHDLLLKIAQATVPHLSSPSPRVRHILLQLLNQISPLLARHENTFLPLVNNIWPGVVQRLFAEVSSSNTNESDGQMNDGELAYNVTCAADVVSGLCENAGDFMASRVEAIFAQLKIMYARAWKQVDSQIQRDKARATKTRPAIEDTAGTHIRGTVDLQVMKSDDMAVSTGRAESKTSSDVLATVSRTTAGQIFSSLVRLLVAILGHVRLSEDNADGIFSLLAPLLDHDGPVGKMVTDALEKYNSDAVWVLRCRKAGEREIENGMRKVSDRVWRGMEMPVLREELENAGVKLRAVVF